MSDSWAGVAANGWYYEEFVKFVYLNKRLHLDPRIIQSAYISTTSSWQADIRNLIKRCEHV